MEAAGRGPREKREVRKQRGKSKTGRKLKKKRKVSAWEIKLEQKEYLLRMKWFSSCV